MELSQSDKTVLKEVAKWMRHRIEGKGQSLTLSGDLRHAFYGLSRKLDEHGSELGWERGEIFPMAPMLGFPLAILHVNLALGVASYEVGPHNPEIDKEPFRRFADALEAADIPAAKRAFREIEVKHPLGPM